MTLLYIDGFDHYTSNTTDNIVTLSSVNWAWSDTHATAPNTNHGKLNTMPELGTRGLQLCWKTGGNINEAGNFAIRTAPQSWVSGSTFGIGFYFYMTALPNSTSYGGIIGWGDAGTPNRSLRLTTGGTIQYWNGNLRTTTGTLIEDTGVNLSTGTLYHIEVKQTLHASTGTIELRLNGQTVWTGTNLNTLGNGLFSHIWFGHGRNDDGVGNNDQLDLIHYDNLYIYDNAGTVNNDFLGERNIATIFVDADATPQEWTLSSGTDAFALLDDLPTSPLTNFISAAADGDESRFTLEDLPADDMIITGIQITPQAYKSGTTNTDLTVGVDVNASEATSTFSLIQDQPARYGAIIEVSPDTGQPFTKAEIQSMEVIVRRTDS